MDGMVGPELWRIPPHQRELTDEGIAVYVECQLPLHNHAEVWCWLHNLITREEAADRLAQEVQEFLTSVG